MADLTWRARGLKPWLWQRLSAAYMAGFLFIFLLFLLFRPPSGFDAWRQWMAHPAVNVGALTFWGLLLMHAWVGMRNVLMDYVRHDRVRFTLLVLVGLILMVMGVWVLRILIAVAA